MLIRATNENVHVHFIWVFSYVNNSGLKVYYFVFRACCFSKPSLRFLSLLSSFVS